MDANSVPQDFSSSALPQSQGMWEKWITGIQNCATRPDGSVQTPSGFCYFWLALIFIGFAGNIFVSIQTSSSSDQDQARKCGKAVSKWRYQLSAVLGLIIGAFNLYIFYNHCARCNGWSGFFITFAIGFLWGVISNMLAPMCFTPPTSQ